MTSIDTEGDALLVALDQAEAAVRDHTFPHLIVRVFDGEGDVVDTIETTPASELLPEDHTFGLWCPRCEREVFADGLSAVDQAERWSTLSGDIDYDGQTATFYGGDGGEFGATLYYLHNETHAVSLPEGWTEDWS